MTPHDITTATVAAIALLHAGLAWRVLAAVRLFDPQPEGETLGRLGLGLVFCAAAGALFGGISQ